MQVAASTAEKNSFYRSSIQCQDKIPKFEHCWWILLRNSPQLESPDISNLFESTSPWSAPDKLEWFLCFQFALFHLVSYFSIDYRSSVVLSPTHKITSNKHLWKHVSKNVTSWKCQRRCRHSELHFSSSKALPFSC